MTPVEGNLLMVAIMEAVLIVGLLWILRVRRRMMEHQRNMAVFWRERAQNAERECNKWWMRALKYETGSRADVSEEREKHHHEGERKGSGV